MLLLALPTIAIAFYFFWHANHYLNILNNQWVKHGIWFGAGLVGGLFLYAWRFRFLSTFIVLVLANIFMYWITGKFVVGEFDTYFMQLNLLVFGYVFSFGWLTAYGFSRNRFFSILWAVIILGLQILLVSKQKEITASSLILAFTPVLLYAFYIVYASELLRNMNEDEPRFGWYVGKRFAGFGLLAALLMVGLVLFFKKDFVSIEKEWGQGGSKEQAKEGNESSLTKENKDGSISGNKKSELKSKQKRGNRLVFVAHLNNFFPSGMANPLYYTFAQYNKFDTLTQTLEIDPNSPSNDLFKPNPSTIPLYFAKSDSQVLINSKANLRLKTVESELYSVSLSSSEFIAPSTSFFCQPIAVGKEFKGQFKFAYRTKSQVSELNSAYFIYNPAGNEDLEKFQEERYATLRSALTTENVDSTFLHYYTLMPHGEDYDSIRALAKRITQGTNNAMDKMLAVRDYFLSKDEFGQPLFKYTDNPGVPGLPSANKLTYFLFENRKGYCAYYAGATLFLLRSLGIPCRVAAGFMAVDRASKNPGWYWFYEDQAHAWVQVYFPEYGWMDFDTTVPDDATRQSPAPDGTPPLNPESAQLVAKGKATSVDVKKKLVHMQVKQLMFHDLNFDLPDTKDFEMDVSMATITKDTGVVDLSVLKPNDEITAMSYAEVFKEMVISPNDNAEKILAMSPKPAPIDEIQIINNDKEKIEKAKPKEETKKPFSWTTFLWSALGILLGFVLMLFATPRLIWAFFKSKAKGAKDVKRKAYWNYQASMYYLNQMGFGKPSQQTALQYAQQKVDPQFGTQFTPFMNAYLKNKYSTASLNDAETKTIYQHVEAFFPKLKTQIKASDRFKRFLHLTRTINFFFKK
jgi:protein-glutamine gamma-glutamyltransferase